MKFILGKKQNMAQYFDEDGKVRPVTMLAVGPMTITQIKSVETDGYVSVQVGFGAQKKERLSKAVQGHLKDLGAFAHIQEFRVSPEEASGMKVGDVIEPSVFKKDEVVQVTSTSKGKGFQGVVKRHGFHGGPRTHGQKHSEREPGSIGGGLRTRVPKGMRMGGRMGSDTITTKNLKVVDVDMERGLVAIEGAVPGRRGTVVRIIA